MKSFELLKKYLYFFGISRCDSNDKTLQFILNCSHTVILIVYLLVNGVYFVFEAQTFAEYSESSFYLLCAILVLWWYIVYLLQRENYVQILDNLDGIIAKSELKRFVHLEIDGNFDNF